MKEKLILVPTEFSTVSQVSFGHAVNIAQHIGAGIHLMHLVDKAGEIPSAEIKLAEFVSAMTERHGSEVNVNTEVKVGDILDDIGATAEALNVDLVVMGTHGLQGIEYIVGTHAVRIVATAQVPFIVVQEKPIRANGYENIIVPMDLAVESKQKLGTVVKMAKYFDSKVHLITPHETDEFLANAIKRNLTYAETYLKQEGVAHTTTMAEEDNDDLFEAVLKFAAKKDADLITIMNGHESKVLGIFGSDKTQEVLINKAMIPVMVLNPKVVSDFELFRTTA